MSETKQEVVKKLPTIPTPPEPSCSKKKLNRMTRDELITLVTHMQFANKHRSRRYNDALVLLGYKSA